LNIEQKTRLKGLLKKSAILLAVGLAYFVVYKILGWGIPCVIRLATDAYCPGCGVSRMCVSLLSGDIESAVRYNLLLMVLSPFILFFAVRYCVDYIKNGKREMDMLEKISAIIAFVLTMAFWIMRNTEVFSWMAPNL